LRKTFFYSLICFSLLITLILLYFYRYDFSELARKTLHREDPQVAAYQHWANHYYKLFSMLKPGERVGIQLRGARSSGILLERKTHEITARNVLFLKSERPGVILIMEPKTAKELLDSVPNTDPEKIWQMMKDRLYAHDIAVWNDPDLKRLQQGGYLAFMRAIDTRPSNLDWPAVKRILGEKQ